MMDSRGRGRKDVELQNAVSKNDGAEKGHFSVDGSKM
jgi:hypothetical protein